MSALFVSHYPSPRTKLASLVKGEVLSPERIRATTGGIATPPFLTLRTNPKHYTKIGHKGQKGKVYNKRSPTACFGNGESVLYICFTLSIYPHRQQAQRFRVRDYPSSQAYILRPKFRLFHRCHQASAYSCYRLPCRLRSACRYLYGR